MFSKKIANGLIVILLTYNAWHYFFSGTSHANFEKILSDTKKLQLKLSVLQNNLKKCEKSRINFKQIREPTLVYEKKRRRIRTTIIYLWNSVKFQIEEMWKTSNTSIELTELLRTDIYEHYISLLSDWKEMSLHDGYENWRQKEAQELSRVVQEKIHGLQHPSDCENAKFLICKSDGTLCGWGCQTEKYAQCLAFALGLQRVLIFEKAPDSYYEHDEYQRYYMPITSCSKPDGTPIDWSGSNDPPIIKAGVLRLIQPRIKYLFSAVPSALADRLEKLFDDPAAWWIAEVEKYLLKLNFNSESMINEGAVKIGFEHPVIGVHIRHTDKVEVAFHNIDEYMEQVDILYDTLELTKEVQIRRVFLCTDEPSIIQEAKEKFPNYKFQVNEENSRWANDLNLRYNSSIGIMQQVFLLGMCDFLVGTLSSNVLRRSYEILHWQHQDAQERIRSLDYRHLVVGENRQLYRVVIEHRARHVGDLSFNIGQILEVADNYDVRGIQKIKDRETFKEGFIPAFKIEKITETVEFPGF